MSEYAKLNIKDGGFNGALQNFLKDLLEKGVVDAVMVPMKLPYKKIVHQTVITNPEKMSAADPLAPIIPQSAAKLLSQLTHKPSGKKLAAVMRPCEIRAFVELTKLHQGSFNDLLLIGCDCLGRYESSEYLKFVEKDENFTEKFLKDAPKRTEYDGIDILEACKACEFPVSDNADINIAVLAGLNDAVILDVLSDKGKDVMKEAGVESADAPSGRDKAIEGLVKERTEYRDKMFEEIRSRTGNLAELAEVLGSCINCYNCRVACPVCYCRECVFVTDTFRHEPDQYMSWGPP